MFRRRTLVGSLSSTLLVALGICSTTRLVDAAGATTVDGYLIDKQCNVLCEGKDANVTCTPDNVNTFYQPEGHTGWCLLLPSCVASGYVLMSETPESSGKHAILLDLSNNTGASRASIVEYIQQGTSGPFPKVTIEYDNAIEGTREVDGIVHVQEITAIRDPWESTDAYYDNAEDTEIVICQDSTVPDIGKNNMCYRSDIIVTDQSNTITIESNGCPTHSNMLNSTGKIMNTQLDPTKEDGGSTTSSSCRSCNGACCSGCCRATFACSGGGDCCSASCSGGCDACSGGCDAGDNIVMENATATARLGGNRLRNLQEEGENTGCDACSTGGCDGCSAGGCDACSAGDCCSSSGAAGCCSAAGDCRGAAAAACCGTFAGSCAATCGSSTSSSSSPGPYAPMYHHYTMTIPSNPGTPGDAVYFSDKEEVIGILVNGVLLDSHKPTWSYDSCNGHSDTKHQYHYHIPPICLLESLGIPTPAGARAVTDGLEREDSNMANEFPSRSAADWWVSDDGTQVREYADMANQFPSSSTSSNSPIIGFARDGYPIFGPYDEEGVLQLGATYNDDSTLDECNGKVDRHGNYGYYMTVTPPFSPPCLRGPQKGTFSYSKHADNKLCPAQGIRTKIIPATEVMDSGSAGSASSSSSFRAAFAPPFVVLLIGVLHF